jgi:hypothetical protein
VGVAWFVVGPLKKKKSWLSEYIAKYVYSVNNNNLFIAHKFAIKGNGYVQ